MARAQAELISTVIIVSIAVTLALGLVYYLTPLLAQARAQQQVMARLAEISSGLNAVLSAYENTSDGFNAVVDLANNGAGVVALYIGVLAYNELGVPEPIAGSYEVYNMTGYAAPLSGSASWALLNSRAVDAGHVYVYVRDGYYSLASLGVDGNYTLYDAGVLRDGGYGVYKVSASGLALGYRYAIAVYAAVGDNYYLVAEVPVPYG